MLELLAATEEHVRDIGIHPYAVGVLVLAFGKGREHT
jgi:hypothetical protein